MKPSTSLKAIALGGLLLPLLSSADVIETQNGARLVGTVEAINGGNITLSTDYAGKLTIKQSEVASISTDHPLVIRLAGGTTMAGTVESKSDGKISIKGEDGVITTEVGKVSTTWTPGTTDPAIKAMQRKWSYEASADVTGKTGNKEEFGSRFGFRAKLAGDQDTLQFYTSYQSQETNGTKSADQFKAGVDYSNNVTQHVSWYARDEGGYDGVKDIDLYNVAAAGLGYDFIENSRQKLTGRAGLSYRYEGYGNPAVSDVSSPGLDFALINSISFENSKMNNTLSYVPSFDDFGNYRIVHDSNFEMPIGSGFWKVRIGVNNDYNSQPSPGLDNLDTTYYTRLILNWGN